MNTFTWKIIEISNLTPEETVTLLNLLELDKCEYHFVPDSLTSEIWLFYRPRNYFIEQLKPKNKNKNKWIRKRLK